MNELENQTSTADINTASDQVRVKWIQANRAYSYSSGNICFLSRAEAELLSRSNVIKDNLYGTESTEGPFVEILPAGWSEPTPKEIPDPEYVNVIFLKAHPRYSYSKGDKGKIAKDQIEVLLQGGFIELIIDKIEKHEGFFKRIFHK